MITSEKTTHWKRYCVIILAALSGITLFAVYTDLWVLTSIPIGFLFGFFLKKGDLCGTSAFSEVILMRDRSKVFGLWVAIVVSMVGYAGLDLFGWVQLNPKPLLWLNYIVGGLLFGVGIVLAGGCVSGCLFKSASGNINSMAGLVGIPLGIALVEHGPLQGFQAYMKHFVLKSETGGAVTLSSLTGVPFWALACFFGLLTLFSAVLWRKQKGNPKETSPKEERPLRAALVRPWKPWKAGLAIGILAIFAYLSSAATGRNYPLGVTHGVLHIQLLLTDRNLDFVWGKNTATPVVKAKPEQKTYGASSGITKTPTPFQQTKK